MASTQKDSSSRGKKASDVRKDSGSRAVTTDSEAGKKDAPGPDSPNHPDPRAPENQGPSNIPTVPAAEPQEVVVSGRPVEPEDFKPEKPETKLEEKEFFYPTHLDPMRKVPGTSTYLDDEQRREAEITRARIEDREPDLDNPPSMQSTPLVQRERLENTNTIPAGVEADVVLEVSVVV